MRFDLTDADTYVLREEPIKIPAQRAPRCVELFAGEGGLAIAASNAGFGHDAVLEYNHDACETILANQRRGHIAPKVSYPHVMCVET